MESGPAPGVPPTAPYKPPSLPDAAHPRHPRLGNGPGRDGPQPPATRSPGAAAPPAQRPCTGPTMARRASHRARPQQVSAAHRAPNGSQYAGNGCTAVAPRPPPCAPPEHGPDHSHLAPNHEPDQAGHSVAQPMRPTRRSRFVRRPRCLRPFNLACATHIPPVRAQPPPYPCRPPAHTASPVETTMGPTTALHTEHAEAAHPTCAAVIP